MEKYRLQVWFEGKVQGVGFRYKTSRIATGYEVSGFVENLDDGRVYLVAVGEEDEVRMFVDEVKKVMDCFIKASSEKADFTTELYKGFDIKL